jgi:hypothetical protein
LTRDEFVSETAGRFHPNVIAALKWDALFPAPLLVEFLLVDGVSENYWIGANAKETDAHVYVAFAELARPITDEFGYGRAAREACSAPSDALCERVRRFVERYGLLTWGLEHDCYPEIVVFDPSGFSGERNRTLAYCAGLRNGAGRYVNSVPWVLREALEMRKALALHEALRLIRSGGRTDTLRALWGWQRGKSSQLFDNDAFEIAAGERWERMVALSALMLSIQALFWPEPWPRPGGGRYGSAWLRPGMSSEIPLINLWLAFFDDILWISGDRECQGCGAGFSPRRQNQTHCTPECGARVRKSRRSLVRVDHAPERQARALPQQRPRRGRTEADGRQEDPRRRAAGGR